MRISSLICCLCLSAVSIAEEPARLRYSTVARLATLDLSNFKGISSQSLRLSARSSNDNVKIGDVAIFLQRPSGAEKIPLDSDGTFRIPITDELRREDPWITANQPKGSMRMRLSYSITLTGPELQVDGKRASCEYRKMFPTEEVRIALRDATHKMDQEAARVSVKGKYIDTAVLTSDNKNAQVTIVHRTDTTEVNKESEALSAILCQRRFRL